MILDLVEHVVHDSYVSKKQLWVRYFIIFNTLKRLRVVLKYHKEHAVVLLQAKTGDSKCKSLLKSTY